MTRLVRVAPMLATLAPPVTILVPPVNGTSRTPAFYRRMLSAFGNVVESLDFMNSSPTSPHADQLGSAPFVFTVRAAMLCCVNSHLMSAEGRRLLLAKTLARWRMPVPPPPPLESRGRSSARARVVRIIKRSGPRQISTHAQLLRTCRTQERAPHTIYQCVSIEFRELPVAAVLAFMRNTSILVGIHGADLANALFLPPNATVVEVFGRHFASPPTYGMRAFEHLAKTRLRHRRLIVDESDSTCVFNAYQRCTNVSEVVLRVEEGPKPCTAKDFLIDCPVNVYWPHLAGLLAHKSRDNPLLLETAPDRGRGSRRADRTEGVKL